MTHPQSPTRPRAPTGRPARSPAAPPPPARTRAAAATYAAPERPHPDGRRPRAPQHERGRRRVDAILDAASALLLEGGLAALSVDAVAKRSGTSKSSMYHFFDDRDAIVRALAERHVATMATYPGFGDADAAEWARLPIEEAVDRYLAPLGRYVADYPDLLPCMQAAALVSGGTEGGAVLDVQGLARTERIVRARHPDAPPAERRARATTLFAVTIGTMTVLSRLGGGSPPRAMMRELRQVLVAYLTVPARVAAPS